MGLFTKAPQVEPGEVRVGEWSANREQNAGRSVTGRLTLTDRRLVFTPNRVDAAFRGETVEVALREVTAVAEERVESTNSGKLETELRITLTGDRVERLSLRDVAAVRAEVQSAVAAAHGV